MTLAIIIVSLIIWKKIFSSKIDRQALQQRNAMYRFRLFQQAFENDDLKSFLPELAEECIYLLFGSGEFSNIGNLSAQDIEKICVEHSKHFLHLKELSPETLDKRKSKDWHLLETSKISGSRRLAFSYLAQQYAKGMLGKEGERFFLNFLQKHKAKAYNLLLVGEPRSYEELRRIYTNDFFREIKNSSDLSEYSQATEYLLSSYLKQQLPPSGKKLLDKFLQENDATIYQKLVQKLPKINRENLAKVYSESFFERIVELKKMEEYPYAFDFLLQSYLEKKTGSTATPLIEKLMGKNSDYVYPKMFALVFQGNTKEFALQMIQDYDHLPTKSKIALLQFKKDDRYVQASIKKLCEQNEDNQWSPLFESISKVLGSRMKIPENVNEVKKIKKLLEFHRDNANSAGNMIKVLDIEKILENMDSFHESLSVS